MEKVSTIGLDIAKNVFQVHGLEGSGAVVVRRALRHSQARRSSCFYLNWSVAIRVRLEQVTLQ